MLKPIFEKTVLTKLLQRGVTEHDKPVRPYNTNEMREIASTLQKLRGKWEKDHAPQMDPNFLVVLGAPASGKSTYVKQLACRTGHVIIDYDDVRDAIPSFRQRISSEMEGGLCIEEADALAYGHWRYGSIFIARHAFNSLSSRGYSMSIPSRPSAGYSLANKSCNEGNSTSVHVILSPKDTVLESARFRLETQKRVAQAERLLEDWEESFPVAHYLLRQANQYDELKILWRNNPHEAPRDVLCYKFGKLSFFDHQLAQEMPSDFLRAPL